MICARCDLPIRKDQPYDSYDHVSNSGGGMTVRWHKGCQPSPTQRFPVEAPRSRQPRRRPRERGQDG